MEIKENEIYTPEEARGLLKISKSTMHRSLKKGILKAAKVGGQYRIIGKNVLHLLSPTLEEGVAIMYRKSKKAGKRIIQDIEREEIKN